MAQVNHRVPGSLEQIIKKTQSLLSNEKKLNLAAVFLAFLFHISGAIGMASDYRDWFIKMTPVNLVLMSLLAILTAPVKGKSLFWFIALCFVTGIITEMVGVNTGLLFGDYTYGLAMGQKLLGVPYLIGVLWFVTVYSAGNVTQYIFKFIGGQINHKAYLVIFSKIVFAALITTVYDYVLEPAALSLGYWTWYPANEVPIFNYWCWFFISGFLLTPYFIYNHLSDKVNIFAVVLFFVQFAFFVSVSIFY
jgi:bisanhydrobacterioruberin hydratase